MSGETNSKDTNSEKSKNEISESGQVKDGLLDLLVFAANEGAMSLGITLFVKGVIVSGMLIGYKKYYDQFLQSAKVIPKGDQKAAVEGLDELKKMLVENANKKPADAPINFIHLEDAVIINSNRIFNPTYLRIRIDSVDAYLMGMPGPEPENTS